MHRFWDTIIRPLLEAVQPKSLVEIGVDTGGNTCHLLEFCQRHRATLQAIDPDPKIDVQEWRQQYGESFVFYRSLSLNAIPRLGQFDVVLIDGDHNWYTVFHELKLIQERSRELAQPFPLILLHDVGWPYGRRDMYYAPETIPEAYRKPHKKKGLHPGSPELQEEEGGINASLDNSIYENNLRNGVLTAVEDFLHEAQEQLELVKIPGFHGLGIIAPGRLVEQNPKFAHSLAALRLAPPLARHLQLIEEARLAAWVERRERDVVVGKLEAALKKAEAKAAEEVQAHNEALRAKTREGETLRRQVVEAEQKHEAQLAQLQMRVAQEQAARARHEAEVEQLQAKLAEAEQAKAKVEEQLRAGEQALAEKDDALARLNDKLNEQIQDVEKLIQLIEQLDRGFRTVITSRRWKLGHTLGLLYRGLRLKPGMPNPQDSWNDKIKKFRVWRSNVDATKRAIGQELPLPLPPVTPLVVRATNGRRELEPSVGQSQEIYQTFLKRSLLTKEIFAPFGKDQRAITAEMEQKKALLLQSYLMRPQDIKVSIIMPTFNRDYIIDRAIRSVQHQYYRNWELLIVDDGGTDHTEAVVAKYHDSRILYSKLKENRKAAGARNAGLAKASGTYIAYLDSDNEWHQEYLLLMVNTLKEHPTFESIYSAQAVFKRARELNTYVIDHIRFGLFHRALLENKNYIDLNAFMHTKQLYEKYGGFDESMRRIEDWEFILRITQETPPYTLDCILGNYYHDDENHAKKERLGPYLALLREKIGFRKLEVTNAEKIIPQQPGALFSNMYTKENRLPPEKVSIVIPSYEAPECLIACVDAIKKYTKSDCYQLIIVDNASSSNEVREYLTFLERNGEAVVQLNQTNFGFTYAVNQGIQLADSSKDLVIMNNDAIVTEGWLEGLSEVKYLVNNVGVIAPRQVLPPFSDTMQTHVPFCRESSEIDVNLSLHHDNIHNPQLMPEKGFIELTFVPFFCVYITRQCVNDAGLLDHINGRHYRSDKLYCDVVRNKYGYKVVYTPHAKVYHLLQRATKELKQKNAQMYQTMFVDNQWSDVSPPTITFGRGAGDGND
jgi:glycosyltransferase involved in cell wall biosynthesis